MIVGYGTLPIRKSMEVFRNLEIRANVPMFGVTDPSRMSAASYGVISTASANDSIRTDA